MSDTERSFCETFHHFTRYQPDDERHESADLPCENRPSSHREYPSAKRIDLSPFVPLKTNPFSCSQIKRSSTWLTEERALGELSRLLYFVYGVTALVPYPPNPILLRATPSAGALYPNEIYILQRDSPTQEFYKVCYFEAKTHSLLEFSDLTVSTQQLHTACFENPALSEASYLVLVTADFSRSAWRYQERGYKRALLDTGHILSNLALLAPVFHKSCTLIPDFHDDQLNALLRLESGNEKCLMLAALSPVAKNEHQSKPKLSASALMQADPEEISWQEMHQKSSLNRYLPKQEAQTFNRETNPEANQRSELLPSFPLTAKRALWANEQSFLNSALSRRSCRRFEREKSLTLDNLSQILSFAYEENSLFLAKNIYTYVLVNDVEGLDLGFYQYLPALGLLRQRRFKDLRTEGRQLCQGQKICEEAAAIVFQSTDLEQSVGFWGERVYRHLHFDAGQLGQRLNLAATALDLGATCIGGYYDELFWQLLGVDRREILLYAVAIGPKAAESFVSLD